MSETTVVCLARTLAAAVGRADSEEILKLTAELAGKVDSAAMAGGAGGLPERCPLGFGTSDGRELPIENLFFAVYAAGGGKRNMANFFRPGSSAAYGTVDAYLLLPEDLLPQV